MGAKTGVMTGEREEKFLGRIRAGRVSERGGDGNG